MKALHIILFTILSLSSCRSDKIDVSKKTIYDLAKGDFKIPSVNGFKFIFFAIDNDVKGCTNVNILNSLFSTPYYKSKYKSFELFLFDVIEQKIKIPADVFSDHVYVFKLDQQIAKKFSDSSIRTMQKEFCDNIGEQKYRIKKKYINQKQLYSILYFFFINDFNVTENDYSGEYILIKL